MRRWLKVKQHDWTDDWAYCVVRYGRIAAGGPRAGPNAHSSTHSFHYRFVLRLFH